MPWCQTGGAVADPGGRLRYAVNVPNFEDYSDVRTVAAVAADAEAAGWDGFFVWDHLVFVKAWQLRIADPWMLLTGVALATERLRLGPLVLTRLWSGETVSFQGRHYRVDQVAFQPTPVQQPRIPIWVAGAWPRRGPLRRAARFDGGRHDLVVGDVDPRRTDLEAFRHRVRQGPPGG